MDKKTGSVMVFGAVAMFGGPTGQWVGKIGLFVMAVAELRDVLEAAS